jgi:hypothetical protein
MRLPLPLSLAAVLAVAPAARAQPVRLVATDHAFQAPATTRPGVRTVRLVNHGQEPHYALLLRLGEGRTLGDLIRWRSERAAPPAWLTTLTGPAPVSPGDSADVELPLAPGRYAVICTYPGPRGPHADLGMVQALEVAGPPVEARPAPVALTLTLTDSTVRGDGPVVAGRRRIAVENHGAGIKQALLVRLPDGVTVADEQRWFDDGFRTPRRGLPAGGVLRLLPGDRVVATVDLRPGRYALLSHASGPWQTLELTVAPR